ncbi:MAG: MEDS domain-containing protein [Acidimicrobiales bacterium]
MPYHHHCLVYDDDAELAPVARGVMESVWRGDHVVVAVDERTAAVLAPLCDLGVATRLDPDTTSPAATLHRYRQLFDRLLDERSAPINVVGLVPARTRQQWTRWARYEAVVNVALAHYPLTGLCLYDRRFTAENIVDELMKTHPCMWGSSSCGPSSHYVEPVHYLADHLPEHRLQPDRPADAMVEEPTPLTARHCLEALMSDRTDARTGLNLEIALSEVVTNAVVHGAPPITMRCWLEPTSIVCAVTDSGPGVSDPLTGWLPPVDPLALGGGRGLWAARQITDDLTIVSHPGDCTVTFTASLPPIRPIPN